ncbi:MAG: hypothetical protein AVDCRST_MAG10-594, partial [uncultured Acidimicrobiales bacterium]
WPGASSNWSSRLRSSPTWPTNRPKRSWR